VALVVTSPPYFAGKEYEAALGEGHVPASYFDYLQMLRNVFAECVRKLEPGGRIAVNVANLGRKPYRSLSADVITILQDDLGLLLRGEIIWRKAEGAGGSCAWGSYQSAANPVLRDLTERVVVASKGRFDRAHPRRHRQQAGLAHRDSITAEEFMAATLDVWDLPAERATRVGHPAPFPVALPRRLIELLTYESDLVLDPFMGSGSTAVAAVRTGRHYAGFDTDPAYVEVANERVAAERERLERVREAAVPLVARPPGELADADGPHFQSRSVREGGRAKELGQEVLEAAGFTIERSPVRLGDGVEVDFAGHGADGRPWLVDVSGAFTSNRAGLRRTDTLWKAIGKAAVIKEGGAAERLLLLTTDLPTRNSAGDKALRAVRGARLPVFDALEMLSPDGQRRLYEYSHGRDEPFEPYLSGSAADHDALDLFRAADSGSPGEATPADSASRPAGP
jgi:site-specific DNA-methyltransferase (adenine-specific)